MDWQSNFYCIKLDVSFNQSKEKRGKYHFQKEGQYVHIENLQITPFIAKGSEKYNKDTA